LQKEMSINKLFILTKALKLNGYYTPLEIEGENLGFPTGDPCPNHFAQKL